MKERLQFSSDLLRLDAPVAVEKITTSIRQYVKDLKRKGAVVGLSGGIDSSVVAALSARALGSERVLVVLMPERESSPESLCLGRLLAEKMGIPAITEDITAILDGAGCYQRRDQ